MYNYTSFFGTGQKIKTVEALCHEIPIIGSNHSFGGIKTSFETHNLNSLEEFIFHIEKIISEPKILQEMKQHSIQILKSYNYTIEEIEKLIHEHLINAKHEFSIHMKSEFDDDYKKIREIIEHKFVTLSLENKKFSKSLSKSAQTKSAQKNIFTLTLN